jgi:Tfp pilus assembly protein PilN
MNMKISLNLLPEQKKEIIQRKRLERFLLLQSFLFLSIVAFYLIVLGGVFFILHENRLFIEAAGEKATAEQSDLQELSRYESVFRDANALATAANRFQRSRSDWTGFLFRLDRLIPPHILLTSLSTKQYQVFLSGTADTRDDFLALETSLKVDACLSDFNVPVSNLFLEKNVEFQFDFTVKNTCLMGTGSV